MSAGTTIPTSPSSHVARKGCIVTVSVATQSRTNTINIILGENQAAPWLESALLGLREGGTAEILDPYFNPVDLHLLRLSLPTDDLPPVPTRDDCLQRAEKLRLDANETFKKSDGSYREVRAAILDYNRALDMVRRAGGDKQLALRLFNNIALCYFRTGNWTSCIAMCDSALDLDDTCAKAYYRRALAVVELDWNVRALADMREAGRLAPEDQVIQRELQRLEVESRKVMLKRRDQFAEVYSRKPQSSVFSDPILN